MANALLVTMVTLTYQVAGAVRVNVTEILTWRTQNLVTPAPVSVSNACFTLTAMRASIVVMVTMETPMHRAAEVSCMFLHLSIFLIFH